MPLKRSPIWFDLRVKPPFGSVQIDWGHPLAQSIAFAGIFNESGAPTDLKNGARGALSNAPIWTSTRVGLGLDFPAGGTAFVSYLVPDTQFLGALTVIWRGIVRTGTAFRQFCDKTDGGAVNIPFDFRTNNLVGNPLNLARGNAGGNRGWEGTASGTVLNEFHQYAVVAPPLIETAPTFYRDLVPETGTSIFGAGTGAATGGNFNLGIGRRADGVVQMDGIVTYCVVWARMLTSNEIARIYFEPYAFLQPVIRRRYFVPAAARVRPTYAQFPIQKIREAVGRGTI